MSLKSSEAEDSEESIEELERHHGEGVVCNQLCNKTVLAAKSLLLSLGAGSPPTGWPTDRIPSGRLASGQPDIRSMFQAIWMRTPIKLAAEKVMEADIALQESEEALHLDRVEALRVKFAKAAGTKAASKEKGVSWSTPEEKACLTGGTKQGINPEADAAADGRPQQKRGSKYCKSLKLDRPINSGITLAQLPTKVDTPQPLHLMEGAGSQPMISSPSTESDDHSPGSNIPAATGLHSSCIAVRIRSTLVTDLATLRQDAQSRASSGDSVSELTEGTWAGATTPDQPSALIPPNYPVPPRRHVPTVDQDNTAHGESMFLLSHRIAPGSRGHFWFLQVGIKYLDNQDARTSMLLGLLSLMDILPNAINGFAMHPLDEASLLPPLTNNKLEDGFPGSVVLAFKYFMVKDKCNRPANQQLAVPPLKPSPHRLDDEEDFKPPTTLWRVIRVLCNGNIKEACESLSWDMVDTGLQVWWKDHQSADLSAQVLLMNVPPVLDRAGVEGKFIWHLAEIEKGLLKKGLLPVEYVGVPLPEIKVSWRQNKQGKGKNKAEKDLTLNNLSAFQENGCLVCTVEAGEGSWPRLAPLGEGFHKMGLSRHALGRSCLMVVMYNGRATDSDRVTMQQLRRVNVIDAYMISHAVLPNIVCVHKRVEIKMNNGSKPLHNFTDLCQEVMWLTYTAADGTTKPFFDAIVPIMSGQQQGSVMVTFHTDNSKAASLVRKMRRSVAGWFFGYWRDVRHYCLEMVRKLMESFDIDAALLAQFFEFDPLMLTVTTTFGDVDEQLESLEANLGIDQGWNADSKGKEGNKFDLVGHCEALAMTLQD